MGAGEARALAEYSRSGALTAEESRSGLFSQVQLRAQEPEAGTPYAYIGPRAPAGRRALVPTVLAISGEEQHHVEKFFRKWRAEVYGWQVVIPLRAATDAAYLYEPQGAAVVVDFMRRILADEERQILPCGVENSRFHLVGVGNGGAAALAVAAQDPNLVASVTAVGGFTPRSLDDLRPLLQVRPLRLIVGEKDEYGHFQQLAILRTELIRMGARLDFEVVEGAGHFTITSAIDLGGFWRSLELSRSGRLAV